MSESVIEYVLRRLHDIGIDAIFGVPGDFAFPIHDVIVNDPNIDWVGCCNELNAGYAADGYARLRGVGALSTTYGVGELSAINAVAGSYAEHLPVFHLTGMPSMPVQAARSLVHHTLGNGEFDLFCKMAEPVVCASAIMTPQNVAYETERLIARRLVSPSPRLYGLSLRLGRRTGIEPRAAARAAGQRPGEPGRGCHRDRRCRGCGWHRLRAARNAGRPRGAT